MTVHTSRLDVKEFEIPETVYSRDIENRVLQMIILQVLSKIDGVGLIEGNLIDTLLGREVERVKGIYVEQDARAYQVKVRAEIKVRYGFVIPKIAEKVQTKIVEEITNLTGLHVASVHVVVKDLDLPDMDKTKGRNGIPEEAPYWRASNEVESH